MKTEPEKLNSELKWGASVILQRSFLHFCSCTGNNFHRQKIVELEGIGSSVACINNIELLAYQKLSPLFQVVPPEF